MLSPKIIELRPDRALLNSNFDGYKLSLQQIESVQEQLDVPVFRALPSSEQYSFLHAKLFGVHNHLVGETVNGQVSVYFVNQDWQILKAYVDQTTDSISDLVEVWKIPKPQDNLHNNYNITVRLVTDKLAIVTDGTGLMYILNTGPRLDDCYWQLQFKDEVLHPNKPFIIQDVCSSGSETLHCLLLSVELDNKENDRHYSFLRWITLLKSDENVWGIISSREFKCKGGIHYAYFETGANAFFVISDDYLECTLDSENPVIEKKSNTLKKNYLWLQSEDDITIKYPLPSNFEKDLIELEVQNSEIKVKYNENNLICGKLHQKINSELTTWESNDKFLEITLFKNEVGLVWPQVVQGDESGELISDSTTVTEIHERLAQFCSENEINNRQCPNGTTFNSQQVEDCDFENDQVSYFQRVSIEHETTHKANIGSHQVLLTVKIDESLPPAFATRYDVDACLWQPTPDYENILKHVGTLLAFGYIQASKQQRKFSVCSPDLSYAVICEHSKHLFIYRQNKMVTSGTLRNRVTGSRVEKVAEQQVVSIPKDEDVLGIYAQDRILFLLTEKTIIAFKM